MTNRTQRNLTDGDIAMVANMYQAWRGDSAEGTLDNNGSGARLRRGRTLQEESIRVVDALLTDLFVHDSDASPSLGALRTRRHLRGARVQSLPIPRRPADLLLSPAQMDTASVAPAGESTSRRPRSNREGCNVMNKTPTDVPPPLRCSRSSKKGGRRPELRAREECSSA
jgi:hypothetical protein